MPLINCPSCEHKVSQLARACPQCAHPFEPTKPITVEQTSKRYKSGQALGLLVIAVGILFATAVGRQGSGFGILLAILGVAVFLMASIGAWWNNG